MCSNEHLNNYGTNCPLQGRGREKESEDPFPEKVTLPTGKPNHRVTLYAKAAAESLDRGGQPSASGIVGPVGVFVMIGTKKLSTIRKEIEKALASPGEDPIRRLERQITPAKRKGHSTEVMEGLKRFLESPRQRKHRKRVGAKSE
jgi:hypothetical protein